MDTDDDSWLDEDLNDDTILTRNSAQEWEQLASRFTDAGYREGITAGQQRTAQAGFDEGFSKTGAPLGREVGFLRGVAGSLLAYLTSPKFSALSVDPSIASSSLSPSPSAPPSKESMIEQTRDLVRRLGKLRLEDLAGKDEEAERHAIEHGEEVEVPKEIREKKEMESLEAAMEGGMFGQPGINGNLSKDEAGRKELERCRTELEEMLRLLGLEEVLRT